MTTGIDFYNKLLNRYLTQLQQIVLLAEKRGRTPPPPFLASPARVLGCEGVEGAATAEAGDADGKSRRDGWVATAQLVAAGVATAASAEIGRAHV